jgi:dihydroorotate dehydrogenase electron transfer subunit
MLAAIARWAMANGARAHLAMESVMACGTGVCRGCPLPRSAEARDRVLAEGAEAAALQGNPEWAMCCTDGPVFESRELDWIASSERADREASPHRREARRSVGPHRFADVA